MTPGPHSSPPLPLPLLVQQQHREDYSQKQKDSDGCGNDHQIRYQDNHNDSGVGGVSNDEDHPFSAEEIQDLFGSLEQDHHEDLSSSSSSHTLSLSSPAFTAKAAEARHLPPPVYPMITPGCQDPALSALQETDQNELDACPHEVDNHNNSNINNTASCGGSSVTYNAIPEEYKTQARSERKRCREKQRRSDVNKQFTELTNVLRRLEATLQQHQASEEGGAQACDSASGAESNPHLAYLKSLPPFVTSPSNRVDLIARTVHMLQALEAERNGLMKRLKASQVALREAQKAGEETAAKLKESMTQPVPFSLGGPHHAPQMLMMVPMIVSGGAGAGGNGTTSNHGHGHGNSGNNNSVHLPGGGGMMMPFASTTAPPPQPASGSIAHTHTAHQQHLHQQQQPQHATNPAMALMHPWSSAATPMIHHAWGAAAGAGMMPMMMHAPSTAHHHHPQQQQHSMFFPMPHYATAAAPAALSQQQQQQLPTTTAMAASFSSSSSSNTSTPMTTPGDHKPPAVSDADGSNNAAASNGTGNLAHCA